MEETGESSRSGANNNKSSKKTTNVPKPSIDVTKVKGWASVGPQHVDVGTAVTHNNLDQIASLLQAIMGKMGDQEKKLNKLTKAFGGDSGNTSRRSSMGSVGQQSSVGEGSAGDISVEATVYDEVMGNLELLDGPFERFLASSDHRPLTRRSKNIQPSVDGFLEAVQQGQDQENAIDGDIVSKLQSLESKGAQDVYLALSKRFNSRKSQGKKVATVTQSFETDIVDNPGDGEGGSQSTEPQTPGDRKGKSVARPPKTPAVRRRRESSSLFVLSEDDDEDESGAEGQTPMPASTEDEDSTFQPN